MGPRAAEHPASTVQIQYDGKWSGRVRRPDETDTDLTGGPAVDDEVPHVCVGFQTIVGLQRFDRLAPLLWVQLVKERGCGGGAGKVGSGPLEDRCLGCAHDVSLWIEVVDACEAHR